MQAMLDTRSPYNNIANPPITTTTTTATANNNDNRNILVDALSRSGLLCNRTYLRDTGCKVRKKWGLSPYYYTSMYKQS